MQKIRRILAIDGGGIRGIIPVTILAEIEKRTGKRISELFDLIAGTSTGGILALGLTKPNSFGKAKFSAQDLFDLYNQEIPNIFRNPQSWWGNLLSPKYRSASLQRVLNTYFEECKLKSSIIDVLVPCYDIEHRSPYIFKSRAARARATSDFLMSDVALAACASPTMFRPVHMPELKQSRVSCLVDGGVFANNPVITALSEVRSMSSNADEPLFTVSIGTGKSNRPLMDEFLGPWGYVHWSRPMLELVMESISESVHQQMQHLVPRTDEQHYYRLQPELPDSTSHAIDNASPANLKSLEEAARSFCLDDQSGADLDRLCKTLVALTDTRVASTT